MVFYYSLILAYDGTDFFGWQQQVVGVPSIQECLKDVFVRVFKQDVQVMGASRTDAGVHALGQVVRLSTELNIEPDKMRFVLNNSLPSAIYVRSVGRTVAAFHPRKNVMNKTYWYHFSLERPLPFWDRYILYHRYPFSIEQFQARLACFKGTHDFSAFATGSVANGNPICTITHIGVNYIQRYRVYRVTIQGNRFLRHMIRRIIGAALLTHYKSIMGLTVADLPLILSEKKPVDTLLTSDPKGLVLHSVAYKSFS